MRAYTAEPLELDQAMPHLWSSAHSDHVQMLARVHMVMTHW